MLISVLEDPVQYTFAINKKAVNTIISIEYYIFLYKYICLK